MAEMSGAFINEQFVGITKKDLSKYVELPKIQIAFYLLQFTYTWLIPVSSDVEEYQEWQRQLKEQEMLEDELQEDANTDKVDENQEQ